MGMQNFRQPKAGIVHAGAAVGVRDECCH
jgi:hypothetical protein